ncbi:MAG: ABC transporter permease [Candidatus Lokiarchaeota archaeon]|nr:ABC transporter permease [Candidatus Lokiarchaeota archaeon]
MKRRKLRYFLTAIALIISVALFGGVSIVSDSFEVMMVETIDKQLGSADVLFKPANITDNWFDPIDITDQIEGISHVDSVAYRITGFNVKVSPTDSGTEYYNSTQTEINGINIDNPDERELGGQPYILDSLNGGTTIEELLDYTDNETGSRVVVISQSLKIELGNDIEAGDTVWILPFDYGTRVGYEEDNTGTWDAYTVTAVIRDTSEARDFDASNTTESEGLESSFLGSIMGPGVFLNISNAYSLVDGSGSHAGEYNLGVVGTDNIYQVSSVTKHIQNILDDLDDGLEWKTQDLKTDSLDMIDTTMSILATVFMIFGIIALILAVILMMNIFNIIRKEQEYETGMFQAIGASKSETFKMFLLQGVIMGVVGSIIGTIASYGISTLIFTAVIDALKSIASSAGGLTITSYRIVLYPVTLISTFVVGLIACILASIYPSWKASRKPIIECLSPIEEKSERVKKHVLRRIIFILLSIGLIAYGIYLLNAPSETHQVISRSGASSGVVTSMFAPVLVLFGIIWFTALCLKPLNKFVVTLFRPYLRKTRLLTEKNILRHRKRTALTFTMIALTTSFLIGMSVMLESIRSGIDTSIGDFMGSDIRVISPTPRIFETGLQSISGVEDVMGVNSVNGQFLIDNTWIGHDSSETDYNETITVRVVDPAKIKEHLRDTTIILPSTATIDSIMDEIESGYNVIIDENLARDYELKVGDVINARLSYGFGYSAIAAGLELNAYNASDMAFTTTLMVSAIISEMQGFATTNLLGLAGQGKQYNAFISWSTYTEKATEDIPGGGTDILLRKKSDTGNQDIDSIQSGWFNFSDIEGFLNNISDIDYYTTRMEYSAIYSNNTLESIKNSVITGVHVNSTGNLRSDIFFGNNSIIARLPGYEGLTMEEVLNTTEKICVVDASFINNSNYKLGDLIYIFPFEFTEAGINAGTSTNFTSIIPYTDNGTIIGVVGDLTNSDNAFLNATSNQNWLAFEITQNFNHRYIKAINVSIETQVNTTVDNIELQALNYYTQTFETLGSINNLTETNNTFNFNLNHLYFNPNSNNLTLRILGYNSTFNEYFKLSIDSLSFGFKNSTHIYDPFNASTLWEPFKIVGIIEAPTLSNFERYSFPFKYPLGNDIGRNSIYISYENARNIVFADYSGSNASYDEVTSVLIHCTNPDTIWMVEFLLGSQLNSFGEEYALRDFRTLVELRNFVFEWYVWIEPGASDETVLDDILSYLEDNGFLVIFSFTRSFMESTFNTMVNLIVFITNSLLLFCIMIAMIGLALHSLLTTMARRREIGMLRSIGLSRSGVTRSISGETYVLAVLGLAVGILAGILQGWLMVDVMPGGGFLAVTFTIPFITIFWLILIVVATVIASSQFPARWAARLNIIDAVRTR